MYPLLWLSLAFLSGLLLVSLRPLPWLAWAGLAALAMLLIIPERRARAVFPGLQRRLAACPLPAGLVLAFLCLGGLRGALAVHATTPASVEYYNGSQVRLVGWVSSPPDPTAPTSTIRIAVETLSILPDSEAQSARPVNPIHGQISLRLPAGQTASYGDRLELTGSLQPPPILASFSYREYLARQGVYSQLSAPLTVAPMPGRAGNPLLRFLYSLRERASAVAVRVFPQPEAALLNGIVLGLDRGIPKDLQEAFQITGTAHIIAISGFNITILAGLFFSLFSRFFNRWSALLAAILSTSLYTLLVGAEPPVTRAALMGALALFGREIGRTSAGLNTLTFTAALMCLFNPALPGDPSFQLSFTATLGMVLYAEPFQAGFRKLAGRWLSTEQVERLSGPVSDYFLTTLAAQVTTLPVMAVHFGRLSLVSLLANPLVLPPQPAVMVLSGLAIFFGLLWLPLGQALAWVAWPFAAYTVRAVDLLARTPVASLDLGQTGWTAAVVYYAALFVFPWLHRHWAGLRAQLKPALLPSAVGLAAVLAWIYAAGLPDGRLHLILFNPPGETGVLIKTGGGNQILIGAPNPAAITSALDARLPLFRRRLDAWLLTTAVPGARLADLTPLARHLALGQVAAPAGLWETEPGAALEDWLIDAGQYTPQLVPGQVFDLGSGERLSVLAVKNSGAALLVEWKDFRALFPGGLSPEDLPASARAPTLLFLPELDPAWEALHPTLTVLTGDGAIPASLTLAEGQWLHVTTDGEQMWLETGGD